MRITKVLQAGPLLCLPIFTDASKFPVFHAYEAPGSLSIAGHVSVLQVQPIQATAAGAEQT